MSQVVARSCQERECLTLGVMQLANDSGIFQVAHIVRSHTTAKPLHVGDDWQEPCSSFRFMS